MNFFEVRQREQSVLLSELVHHFQNGYSVKSFCVVVSVHAVAIFKIRKANYDKSQHMQNYY